MTSGVPRTLGLNIGTPRVLTEIATGRVGLVTVTRLDHLLDVELSDVPENVPLIWRLHPDGIYRTEPLPESADRWGDDVRFAAGAPSDEAPAGVFHVDYTTGQLYEKET